MIMTTVAPVESAYAAEEFQAEETEAAAFEDAESGEETGTDTYGAEETSETDGEDTAAEPDSDSANADGEDCVDDQTGAGAFDDSAEELTVDTDSASEQEEAVQTDDGFSSGEAEVAGVESVMGSGSCGDSATYTLYSDGRLVIEGSGEVEKDFYDNEKNIKSVEIGEGITSLKNDFQWSGVFQGCSNLVSITLPESLTNIGDYTFRNCGSLKEIVIPKGVTSIGEYAFDGCSSLSSIILSDKITSIGNYAFYNTGLKEISLPDTLTEIGSNVFSSCSDLRKVKLPSGIKKISAGMFDNCERLNSIEIPESVTDIGEYAFKSCNMAEIQLPKSLTSLKYGTFMSCSNLTTICIPKAVTSIDTDAFKSCQALRSVYIENGATKIEKHAFGYNTDTEKKSNFVVIGQKNSTAEKYATENSFTFHNVTDPLKYYERVEATCISDGNMEYWYCDKCGEKFSNAEGTEVPFYVEISKYGHNMEWISWESPSCITAGHENYYHCKTCGKNYSDYQGKTELTEKDIVIPAYGHNLEYNEAKEATCVSCGKQDWGQNLTYKLYINTDQVILKYGQSTTAVRASGFTNGDYLKSVTVKNKNLVTVSSVNKNGTFKLTAKNKSGRTYITVKLNSGVNADVMVYIQKGKVSTNRITNLKSSVSVVRGSNVTLKPVLDPITSQDKITYSTSNKSIATVSSKGVVKGIKKGTATITVQSGSKKLTCKVTVR